MEGTQVQGRTEPPPEDTDGESQIVDDGGAEEAQDGQDAAGGAQPDQDQADWDGKSRLDQHPRFRELIEDRKELRETNERLQREIGEIKGRLQRQEEPSTPVYLSHERMSSLLTGDESFKKKVTDELNSAIHVGVQRAVAQARDTIVSETRPMLSAAIQDRMRMRYPEFKPGSPLEQKVMERVGRIVGGRENFKTLPPAQQEELLDLGIAALKGPNGGANGSARDRVASPGTAAGNGGARPGGGGREINGVRIPAKMTRSWVASLTGAQMQAIDSFLQQAYDSGRVLDE